MNRLAVFFSVALLAVAGCGWRGASSPPPREVDPAIEIIADAVNVQDAKDAKPAKAAPVAATQEKSWADDLDIDKIAENKWVWAAVFLLVQWLEILYFNKTGRKSKTIDAAEAAMQPKLGVIQRMLYRLWRWCYFWKNKDQKDPDKDEEEKKK